MKDKMNRYEKFRVPAIAGSANLDNMSVTTIFSRGSEAVTLYTAEIIPGVFDYGFKIYFLDGDTVEKLPGEGQGVFRNIRHAKLFGLERIRLSGRLSEDAREAIRDARDNIQCEQPSLFD